MHYYLWVVYDVPEPAVQEADERAGWSVFQSWTPGAPVATGSGTRELTATRASRWWWPEHMPTR